MRLAALAALLLASFLALAGDLPDPRKTPGVIRPELTPEAICKIRWGKDRRFVMVAMRREVFAAYGLSGPNDAVCKLDKHGRRFEVDHLVSRELGGADDVRNLWPQCYAGKWGASLKDALENKLHREMCAGRITLKQAQEMLINDWRVAYKRYYGEPN